SPRTVSRPHRARPAPGIAVPASRGVRRPNPSTRCAAGNGTNGPLLLRWRARDPRPDPIASEPPRGCAVVRKLGLATVSAVLVGTIAVVVPSRVAHGAPTVLPDPISGRCAANEATDCWRYITFSDDDVPNPPTDPPEVQGSRII